MKHECIVCVAGLTDSQCMSCSRMTNGTHTSFIMTAGGLDQAPAGPVSSRQADARVTGLSMRRKKTAMADGSVLLPLPGELCRKYSRA